MAHRILVADDEPSLLRLMDVVLARQGHVLLRATNGEDALALARERRPDLIVLDIMMPGLNGYEVIETLRADADADLARIPIVVLTARAQEADIEYGLAVGADRYVTKPFSPNQLVEAVAACLSPADQRGALAA